MPVHWASLRERRFFFSHLKHSGHVSKISIYKFIVQILVCFLFLFLHTLNFVWIVPWLIMGMCNHAQLLFNLHIFLLLGAHKFFPPCLYTKCPFLLPALFVTVGAQYTLLFSIPQTANRSLIYYTCYLFSLHLMVLQATLNSNQPILSPPYPT